MSGAFVVSYIPDGLFLEIGRYVHTVSTEISRFLEWWCVIFCMLTALLFIFLYALL